MNLNLQTLIILIMLDCLALSADLNQRPKTDVSLSRPLTKRVTPHLTKRVTPPKFRKQQSNTQSKDLSALPSLSITTGSPRHLTPPRQNDWTLLKDYSPRHLTPLQQNALTSPWQNALATRSLSSRSSRSSISSRSSRSNSSPSRRIRSRNSPKLSASFDPLTLRNSPNPLLFSSDKASPSFGTSPRQLSSNLLREEAVLASKDSTVPTLKLSVSSGTQDTSLTQALLPQDTLPQDERIFVGSNNLNDTRNSGYDLLLREISEIKQALNNSVDVLKNSTVIGMNNGSSRSCCAKIVPFIMRKMTWDIKMKAGFSVVTFIFAMTIYITNLVRQHE